jgi:DMSO/TMAO reductase YedYZ molybdopterin-dependent catalytic subunit
MLRLALAFALTAPPAAPATHAVAPVLTVDGAVPRPALFDAAAFAALPHASATATIHGTMLTCTGVWLADVVAAAGVPTGEAVRGPGLAMVVVARGADGYRVVFSLGEIERSLGRGQILVADRCNDAPLADGDGPYRLVVANEVRGARSVKALTRLSVVAVP